MHFHWPLAEWAVTFAQGGEPFSDWLMSVWWVDSGKVRLGEL